MHNACHDIISRAASVVMDKYLCNVTLSKYLRLQWLTGDDLSAYGTLQKGASVKRVPDDIQLGLGQHIPWPAVTYHWLCAAGRGLTSLSPLNKIGGMGIYYHRSLGSPPFGRARRQLRRVIWVSATATLREDVG
jgi:hypothetical protein